MTVTVYTKPSCVQCTATKKALDALSINYTLVDITVDTEAYDKVKALGFMSAPVVIAGEKSWAGFRPDMIKELTA